LFFDGLPHRHSSRPSRLPLYFLRFVRVQRHHQASIHLPPNPNPEYVQTKASLGVTPTALHPAPPVINEFCFRNYHHTNPYVRYSRVIEIDEVDTRVKHEFR